MSNVVETESNFMADATGLESTAPYDLQLREEKGKVLVAQSCLTLRLMDCNTGSSVHGSLQARILKWIPSLEKEKCHFLLQGIFLT